MTITKELVDNAISSDDELSAIGKRATFIPVYGNDVTAIGDNAFEGFSEMSVFMLPAELQKIGNYAFSKCIALSSVDISQTEVSSIGAYAYQQCSSIQDICLPNTGVICADNYAFLKCTSLSCISSDADILLGDHVFNSCNSLSTTLAIPHVKSVGNFCFIESGIMSAMLDECEFVNLYAFSPCAAVKHVSFGKLLSACGNMTYMPDAMFDEVYNLTCVNMPQLSMLNCGLMNACYAISSVSMPSLEVMNGTYAFMSYCPALTSVDLPKLATTRQTILIECNAVSSICMPSLTAIGFGARVAIRCSSLTSIDVPNLKSFQTQLVENCDSLISVHVDNTVYHSINNGQVISRTDNDNDWVWVSDKLDTIVNDSITTLPVVSSGIKRVSCKNVTQVASNDMRNRKQLEYVNLPSLKDVGINFTNCTGLLSLDFSGAEVLFTSEEDDFGDNNNDHNCLNGCVKLSAISLPHEGIKTFGTLGDGNAFIDTKLYDDQVQVGNTVFKLETYCLQAIGDIADYADDEVTLIGPKAFYSNGYLMNVNCPKCRYVNQFAFCDCGNLIDVQLENVEAAGTGAFNADVSLTSISLPRCKKLGASAFEGDESLVEVNLPECEELCGASNFLGFAGTSISLPSCKAIGDSPFNSCPNLQVIDMPCVESFRRFAIDCPNLMSAVMSSLTAVPKVNGEEYENVNAFENVHNEFKIYVNSSIYDEMATDSYWNKFFTDKLVAI